MSCGEKWETSAGSTPLHDMTDEHLRNAQRHSIDLLQLARQKKVAAESDIIEGERRFDQTQREVERRNRQKCGIAEYGKALKVGDYVRFTEYSAEELTPNPPTFKRGDILRVTQVGNGVSREMLDVRRVYDGRTDSVWPEEVEKVEHLLMPTAMHTAEKLRNEIVRLQRENDALTQRALHAEDTVKHFNILTQAEVIGLRLRTEHAEKRANRAEGNLASLKERFTKYNILAQSAQADLEKQVIRLRLTAQNAADDLQTVVDVTR